MFYNTMYLVVMFNCSIQINEYSIFKMGWRRTGLEKRPPIIVLDLLKQIWLPNF